MARYVVVEFQDNEVAAKFIDQVNRLNAAQREDRVPLGRRIVGVFVSPGRRCGCGDWSRANIRSPNKNGTSDAGIIRGEKFGWWVCSRCNKPRIGSHTLVNQLLLSETYEGPVHSQPGSINGDSGAAMTPAMDFEVQIDSLGITGIATKNIDRPKKLRRKKKKS